MDTEILTDELVQFSPKSGLLYAPSADSGAAPLLCREEYPRVTGFGEVNRTGMNKKKVDSDLGPSNPSQKSGLCPLAFLLSLRLHTLCLELSDVIYACACMYVRIIYIYMYQESKVLASISGAIFDTCWTILFGF